MLQIDFLKEQENNPFVPKVKAVKKKANTTKFPDRVKGKRQETYLFQVYREQRETKRLKITLHYKNLQPFFGSSDKIIYQNFQNMKGSGYITAVKSHRKSRTIEITINDEQLMKMHEWFDGMLPPKPEPQPEPQPEPETPKAAKPSNFAELVISEIKREEFKFHLDGFVYKEFVKKCKERGVSQSLAMESMMRMFNKEVVL